MGTRFSHDWQPETLERNLRNAIWASFRRWDSFRLQDPTLSGEELRVLLDRQVLDEIDKLPRVPAPVRYKVEWVQGNEYVLAVTLRSQDAYGAELVCAVAQELESDLPN